MKNYVWKIMIYAIVLFGLTHLKIICQSVFRTYNFFWLSLFRFFSWSRKRFSLVFVSFLSNIYEGEKKKITACNKSWPSKSASWIHAVDWTLSCFWDLNSLGDSETKVWKEREERKGEEAPKQSSILKMSWTVGDRKRKYVYR